MKGRFLFLLFPFISFVQFAVADVNSTFPFKVGERLEYDLSWGFFPVGSAIMQVESLTEMEGELCYLVKFSVRTNSFADQFYKVRTTIESTVSSDFSRSINYQKSQQEGSTKRKIVVRYDYEQQKAFYWEGGKVQSSVAIPNKVLDPLSIAYFFRTQEIQSGHQKTLPTCDGKRFREIIVRAGKKKKISVPAGKFYAIETMPEMQNLRGVFKKSPDGILRVWYSTDRRRIPVKISSKVIVGSFNANLRKTSGLN
ncbi:MAG: DUF3108 domain-containing protein [Opitutales bacterium]|nr:DUF3108 domain-containing protein [Opitutales bacterium]MDG1325260.1 DUF3108 domain-containing protein [Opitutales bacterium]